MNVVACINFQQRLTGCGHEEHRKAVYGTMKQGRIGRTQCARQGEGHGHPESKPYARFDEGGLVMASMDWLLRHRQTKGAATDRSISNDAGACPLLYPIFVVSDPTTCYGLSPSSTGTKSSAPEKMNTSESCASKYCGKPLSVFRVIEGKERLQLKPNEPLPAPES